MKNCPNCHNQAKDDAIFCPVCGTMLDAVPQPSVEYYQPSPVPSTVPTPPATPDYVHTSEFNSEDIKHNKLICMVVYLLDFIGVIIALLMQSGSEYTHFHIRQSLKFTVLEALISLISLLLCWTFVVPIIGMVALILLTAVKLCCFLDVCKGEAKDAPIIRSIKFLN